MATKKHTAPVVETAVVPDDAMNAALEANTGAVAADTATPEPSERETGPFTVRIVPLSVRLQRGPGLEYTCGRVLRRNETYACTEVRYGWARLASGEGWLRLSDVEIVNV